MKLTVKDYASLCKDSYENPYSKDHVTLDGATYKVFDYYSNPITGYQGVA